MTPPKPKLPRWATEIPGRRPIFKMHNGLGQAKAAFSWSDSGGRNSSMRPGKLYELVDGDWEVVAVIERGQKRKDHPFWAESEAKKHKAHHKYVDDVLRGRRGIGTGTYLLDNACPWCGKTGREIVGIGP